MKKSLILIAMAALMLMVTGCRKDEEYAYPAVYGNIVFSPSNPKVGQEVTMTAQVLDPGHRIYHADYTWKCSEFENGYKIVRKTAPDNSKTITEAPSCKFTFTEAGTFSVSMSASFKFSMTTEGGALFGSASTKTFYVKVRE